MTTDSIPASLNDIAQQIARGDFAAAEIGCHRLLAQRHDLARALFLLGVVCRKTGRPGYAGACLDQAIRLQPGNAEFRNEFYDLHWQFGNAPAALEQLDWCAVLQPQRPELFHRAGKMHAAAGRYEEALKRYRRAQVLGLNTPQLTMSFATALHSLRRLDEAERYFQEALSAEPRNPAFRWEYAMQELLLSRWGQGWDDYEMRLQVFGHRALNSYPFPFPQWQGEPLAGKTILIHGEQGLGDEIMFCSMIPELVAQAGRCIVACAPNLHSLFARSFKGADVRPFGRGDPQSWERQPPALLGEIGAVDYQVNMGSLARVLRRSAEAFKVGAKPYLHADPERVGLFRDLLAQAPNPQRKLSVGLVWSGNMRNGLIGSRKSIPIELLRGYADLREVRWVSLHIGDYGDQHTRVPELGIVDFSQRLRDAGDTAALIECMDLVISVDTMTAHLAGAMGKETWVPLWQSADWRWEWAKPTSLWYANTRLFRQEQAGDWTPVLAAMHAALAQRLSGA